MSTQCPTNDQITQAMLKAGAREVRRASFDFWESLTTEQCDSLVSGIYAEMCVASEDGRANRV